MRFKTKLKVDRVSHLLKMVQVLEKLDKRCVLHLPEPENEHVRIVVQGDVIGNVACYVHFKSTEWFESYRIESQNNNQIGLDMDIQNLLRALRSASAADQIQIKLAKKGVPVLTFEIATPLGPILQDIPVVVLSAVRLAEFQEPQQDCIKGFTLPPLAKLHNTVDKMKGLSNSLQLHANLFDEHAILTLTVKTDTASVSTKYTDLSLASYDAADSNDHYQIEQASVGRNQHAMVDLRNFSRTLFGHQMQPNHGLCFIHPSHVMIHLMGPWDASITYYIPRRLVADS